jgi:hypothetical protein
LLLTEHVAGKSGSFWRCPRGARMVAGMQVSAVDL